MIILQRVHDPAPDEGGGGERDDPYLLFIDLLNDRLMSSEYDEALVPD